MINNVTAILFDTGVVMVTILSAIQTLRLWQKGDIWDKKSLISLMIYQDTITTKVQLLINLLSFGVYLAFSHNLGVKAPLWYEVKPGWHLKQSSEQVFSHEFKKKDLIVLTGHNQLVNNYYLPLSPNSQREIHFQAARQSVHNAIVAEFGNPHLSREDFNAENLEDNVADQEGQESPQEAGSGGMELDEFPCTTGCPGNVELAGQIASGEQIWKNGRGLMTASKLMHHSHDSNTNPLAEKHGATYINLPF
ncbi:hypothetical protein JB92DRAFT_2824546 [Gautieria morchelliformis]|nr:hypothetical protein JB92DRAFT_2824546 [Gautieria morchelliformis]